MIIACTTRIFIVADFPDVHCNNIWSCVLDCKTNKKVEWKRKFKLKIQHSYGTESPGEYLLEREINLTIKYYTSQFSSVNVDQHILVARPSWKSHGLWNNTFLWQGHPERVMQCLIEFYFCVPTTNPVDEKLSYWPKSKLRSAAVALSEDSYRRERSWQRGRRWSTGWPWCLPGVASGWWGLNVQQSTGPDPEMNQNNYEQLQFRTITRTITITKNYINNEYT